MDRENLRTWQEMPPLDGVNRVEPKPRATTLLEKEEGAGQPLLLIGRYGQGRTLALVTDDSWKWYAGMIARGEGNWAYLRFMDRLVRWLTKDPSLEPIQLTLLGESRIPGEKQEIKIQLREEGGHRWGKAGIRMAVRSPQGSKVESQLGPSGQAGDYLGSFVPDQEGIYKVRVETPDGSWEKPVVIAAPIENRDAAPAHNRLQRISASTGGKALSRGDEVLSMVETLAAKKEKRLVEENSSPLWANFIVLGFIVALLSAEWYWRRKWGLV